jgi:two-component system OmpR family response regulator
MKLLLIEDNRSLAIRLKKSLSEFFVVDAVHTGKEGLAEAQNGSYAAIVLDLTLPDISGYEICRELRRLRVPTPILVLSGVAEVSARVTLLNEGADDYLTKPFTVAELRARLNALLRRSAQAEAASGILTIQDLTIDINRRKVVRDGKNIVLRRKEFDILEYLIRNRGHVMTRAMILDHVWDTNRESWPNTVDVHIKHLRDKVDRPFGAALIKTAYGVGYLVDDSNANLNNKRSY